MRRHVPHVLAPCFLAGIVSSQTTTVIPQANTAIDGSSLEAKPFGYNRVRLTQLIDLALVKVPLGRTITQVAYRRDKKALPTATLRRVSRTGNPNWQIAMANIDYNAPAQRVGRITYPNGQAYNPRHPTGAYLSPATTKNRLTVVYSAKHAFPDLAPVTGPSGPFVIRFPLARPFVLTGPHGWAIDHYVYEARAVFQYYIDAARASVDTGKAVPFGVSCPKDANRNNVLPTNPGGEPFSMLLFDGPPSSVAVGVLGASRTKWGPWTLPLDLNASALPGCFINVSVDVLLPVATFTTGAANVSFNIPADKAFAGLKVFTQWMAVDSRVNPALSLAFSNGVDVTLGTTVGPCGMPAAMVYGVNLSAVVRGRYGIVDRNVSLVTEVTYK